MECETEPIHTARSHELPYGPWLLVSGSEIRALREEGTHQGGGRSGLTRGGGRRGRGGGSVMGTGTEDDESNEDEEVTDAVTGQGLPSPGVTFFDNPSFATEGAPVRKGETNTAHDKEIVAPMKELHILGDEIQKQDKGKGVAVFKATKSENSKGARKPKQKQVSPPIPSKEEGSKGRNFMSLRAQIRAGTAHLGSLALTSLSPAKRKSDEGSDKEMDFTIDKQGEEKKTKQGQYEASNEKEGSKMVTTENELAKTAEQLRQSQ